VIDVDGMIARLAVLLEDADASSGLEGRLENDLLEKPFVDVVGTGERQHEPRAADPLEGQTVDVLIAAAGGDDVGFFLGEGRRVEDDEVVVEGRLPQEFEHMERGDAFAFMVKLPVMDAFPPDIRSLMTGAE